MQPPDHHDHSRDDAISVAEALRRVPLETPPRSAWPALRSRLDGIHRSVRQRRIGSRRHWLAAAAVLVLALALPSLWQNPKPLVDPVPPSTRNAHSGELAALRQESAALEAWLATTRDDAVISATGDALRAALTERVQYVDALIGDPETAADTQLPLWRERVLLLRRLASIESSEQLLAVSGEADDSRLVLAF